MTTMINVDALTCEWRTGTRLYIDVATCIIENYSFMKASSYMQRENLIVRLSNHMKEQRKPHVPRKSHAETQATAKQQNSGKGQQ